MANIFTNIYRRIAVWHSLATATPKTIAIVVFLLFFNLLPLFAQVNTARAEFSLSGGFFYTQAGDKGDKGFSITDDANVPMWQEYNRLGGPAVLGYPSSWRFTDAQGNVYQATQGALLEWSSTSQKVLLANVLDMISSAGQESLLTADGIPPAIQNDGSGGNPQAAQDIRLSWLTNPAIRAYYFANPNPKDNPNWDESRAIDLYGLPTSLPQEEGPYVVQRFEHTALQLWVDRVPGMPEPGTVVRVLVGDLAKEAGVVPYESTVPLSTDNPLLRADPELREPMRILESARDQLSIVATSIEDYRVSVVFAQLDDQTVAQFVPGRRTIEVNQHWQDSDPRALAAVLSHEATHVADYYTGVKADTPTTCVQAEERAFTNEANFWSSMFGYNGKQPAQDDLDRQLNIVESSVADQVSFNNQITVLYRKQCGG